MKSLVFLLPAALLLLLGCTSNQPESQSGAIPTVEASQQPVPTTGDQQFDNEAGSTDSEISEIDRMIAELDAETQ